jgi:phospholipid/cholesterol/gamma-HCH transport system substrate-binding protein
VETRASYVLVGAFVLALVAVALGFVVFFARGAFETGGQVYEIDFTGSVTGLEVGSRVRYRGVPVGSVTSIRLNPQNVAQIQVLAKIDPGTPIKQDTEAALGLSGITGIAYLSLSGGTQTSPPLTAKEGQRYPVIPSHRSQLETVLENLPRLSERAVELLDRLSNVLNAENAKAISDTLANVSRLTGTLAARSGDIDKLIGEAAETVAALRRTAQSMDRMSEEISKQATPLGSDARRTLTEFRQAAHSMAATADSVRAVVDENRRPLKDFSANGLYELSEFLTEARVLVANFNQLIQQIQRDPARFFFGDTQKGYEPK